MLLLQFVVILFSLLSGGAWIAAATGRTLELSPWRPVKEVQPSELPAHQAKWNALRPVSRSGRNAGSVPRRSRESDQAGLAAAARMRDLCEVHARPTAKLEALQQSFAEFPPSSGAAPSSQPKSRRQ